ncbi:MAG: helix-turn-helix transcriptional regulator [Actinomycetota bacterium]
MSEYEFILVIDADLDDDAVLDRLFEAGCDDATLGMSDGVGYGEFHREAPNFRDALMSAIYDVEVGAHLRVLHVEPDDLVTMADIARRLNKSREYIRQLVLGRKGPGDFPPPVSHLHSRSSLWRWSDVASWAGQLDPEMQERARLTAGVNGFLEMRRARLEESDAKELLAMAGG